MSKDTPRQPDSGSAAVGAMLGHCLPRLRAYVRMHMEPWLRDLESCSDLVQSVCADILQRGGAVSFATEGELCTYLYKAALNKVREYGRYHAAERRNPRKAEARVNPAQDSLGPLAELYARTTSPSQAAIGAEFARRFETALDRLAPEERELFALARILGLPRAELAQRFECREGALRMQLSRITVKLLAILEGRNRESS